MTEIKNLTLQLQDFTKTILEILVLYWNNFRLFVITENAFWQRYDSPYGSLLQWHNIRVNYLFMSIKIFSTNTSIRTGIL